MTKSRWAVFNFDCIFIADGLSNIGNMQMFPYAQAIFLRRLLLKRQSWLLVSLLSLNVFKYYFVKLFRKNWKIENAKNGINALKDMTTKKYKMPPKGAHILKGLNSI